MDDNSIIALYNQRNERAIAETDKKYGNYCLTIAFNVLNDRQDSEECVNDTYLRVWNAIPPAMPQRFKAFLGRITRNLAIDRYRSNARRVGRETDVALHELEECLKTEISEVDSLELSEAINSFLRSLSERDCNIFLCRYYFVYPIKEIAKRQGMKENHVRSLLSRTREKLREHLKKEGITL